MAKPLRGKILDDFAMQVFEEAKANGFMRLTPSEAKAIINPVGFLERTTLDEKMMIAHKLNKRMFVVVIDEDAKITKGDFSKIFFQTYMSEEANSAAIERIDEIGLVVIGGETIARHLQRTELFLSSDLYEISKILRKMKNKKVGVKNYHFKNNESELKNVFMHFILRCFFETMNMNTYLDFMEISRKEFGILSLMWMSGRPMDNDVLRSKLENILGTGVGDIRSSFKHLHLKRYIRGVEKEPTHHKKRIQLWMLTEAGHDCISKFIHKVTEHVATNIYE